MSNQLDHSLCIDHRLPGTCCPFPFVSLTLYRQPLLTEICKSSVGLNHTQTSFSELLEEPEVSGMGRHDGFIAAAALVPSAVLCCVLIAQMLGVVPRVGQLWWLLLYGLQDRTDEHQVSFARARGKGPCTISGAVGVS